MSAETRQMEYVPLSDLELTELRDVREDVVSDIANRIETNEYNPSRPLRVIENGEGYKVADGNHRVAALRQLETDPSTTVPCIIEPRDVDLHKLAIECNRDEDTYAEMDLFDHLDFIDDLRGDHTQEEIADKLDWSRKRVADHSRLLSNIVPTVLETARLHQEGRGTSDVPNGTFDFTEGWFRNSGLYELNAKRQQQFIEWFCEEQACDVANSKAESKVESLQQIQYQLEHADENLNSGVDDGKRQSLTQDIKANAYTDEQLRDTVEKLNRGAKNQAHYGSDALEELRRIDENEVDCVVTDPPWGVEFESRRETDHPDYDSTKEETLAYLDEVFTELERVCKANAHIYVIFPIAHYCEFQQLAGEYFEVNDVPLMWVKNNHAPVAGTNGYETRYARKYEPIYLCRMENGLDRTLNKDVSPNVLEYDRPPGEERWHDSQKPMGLLEDLITNSTGKHETVLDPFAGSGVAMLAAAKNDRHYIGIEKDDSYEGEFRKHLREFE